MKIYKTFAISALLLCSTIGVAFAQNYWCSSGGGSGYLATLTKPEDSCEIDKAFGTDAYEKCVKEVKENNAKTNAELKKGTCKPIQEKQATYGQTKCKYFYIIENGKIEDKGYESASLSKNVDLEREKCLQIAKDELAKTLPATSSSTSSPTSVKWADQNLSTSPTQKPKAINMGTTTKPASTVNRPYSTTPSRTNYYKPMYKLNNTSQSSSAPKYTNPSDAYKK